MPTEQPPGKQHDTYAPSQGLHGSLRSYIRNNKNPYTLATLKADFERAFADNHYQQFMRSNTYGDTLLLNAIHLPFTGMLGATRTNDSETTALELLELFHAAHDAPHLATDKKREIFRALLLGVANNQINVLHATVLTKSNPLLASVLKLLAKANESNIIALDEIEHLILMPTSRYPSNTPLHYLMANNDASGAMLLAEFVKDIYGENAIVTWEKALYQPINKLGHSPVETNKIPSLSLTISLQTSAIFPIPQMETELASSHSSNQADHESQPAVISDNENNSESAATDTINETHNDNLSQIPNLAISSNLYSLFSLTCNAIRETAYNTVTYYMG